MTTADKKADIFQVLGKINAHDVKYIEALSPEEHKQLHPFVLQRWLSGTSNASQIYLLNEVVNSRVFTLAHEHRMLVWYLLVAATCNKGRYQWIKPMSAAKSAPALAIEVIQRFHGYSRREAVGALPALSNEDLLYMAGEVGMQSAEVKKLEKELKTRVK